MNFDIFDMKQKMGRKFELVDQQSKKPLNLDFFHIVVNAVGFVAGILHFGFLNVLKMLFPSKLRNHDHNEVLKPNFI